MKPYDLDAFQQFMGDLADCYGRPAYTTGALKQWADALVEFEWRQVKAKLSVWRDSNPRAPQVADILPALKQIRDFERLRDKQKKGPSEPAPVTEYGQRSIEAARRKIAHSRRPGNWWAYEVRDKHRSGAKVSLVQLEAAMAACGADWDTDKPYRDERVPDRVPGSDDE